MRRSGLLGGLGIFLVRRSRRIARGTTAAPGGGKSTGNVYDCNVYYGVLPADDPHALTSNPLMENPSHGAIGRDTLPGYALAKNSPAIDSGKVMENSGGKDFLGVNVPQCGGVDRGAMEATACGSK